MSPREKKVNLRKVKPDLSDKKSQTPPRLPVPDRYRASSGRMKHPLDVDLGRHRGRQHALASAEHDVYGSSAGYAVEADCAIFDASGNVLRSVRRDARPHAAAPAKMANPNAVSIDRMKHLSESERRVINARDRITRSMFRAGNDPRAVFESLDTSGDGFVDLREFKQGLAFVGATVDAQDAAAVFSSVADKDGKLGYDKLLRHLRNTDEDVGVSLPIDEDLRAAEAHRRKKFAGGYHISMRSNPVFRPAAATGAAAAKARRRRANGDRGQLSPADRKRLLIQQKVRRAEQQSEMPSFVSVCVSQHGPKQGHKGAMCATYLACRRHARVAHICMRDIEF